MQLFAFLNTKRNIGMKKENLLPICCVLFAILFLTSCNSVGLMSEKNSWLPHEIEGIGDFFSAYITIQLSILIVSILLSFILGQGAYIVVLILHFIWIVTYRDYGFFIVLLLFGLFSVISFVINSLNLFSRNND
jgi:hypothetical protein